MLDQWIEGSTDRISPEAPVPVLKQTNTHASLGGAANLAVNLASLSSLVDLHGAIANDTAGKTILAEIATYKNILPKLDTDATVTTTKTRLVGQGGQHILRLDHEQPYTGNCLYHLRGTLCHDQIVCISDYNKGVVTRETVEQILKTTSKIFVDPKQSAQIYANAFLVKPNLKEFKEWFGEFNDHNAHRALEMFNWTWLVVTCGADGIYVYNKDGSKYHYKEPVREVADVTGAGDTVLAVIVHLYSTGVSIPNAVAKACFAAARVVEQRGVVAVNAEHLNQGVVFTNGCFDVLHLGHIKMLEFAKAQGKRLIVGLNSDASITRLKGPTRPNFDVKYRKRVLESLTVVDQVIVFDEDTPIDLIKSIQPDIIVKGGDYTEDQVVGNSLAKVVIFPREDNYSTTNILEGKL